MASSRSLVVVLAIVVGCHRRDETAKAIVAVPSAEARPKEHAPFRLALGEGARCIRSAQRLIVLSTENALVVDARTERHFRVPGLTAQLNIGAFGDRLIYGKSASYKSESVPFRAISLISGAPMPPFAHVALQDNTTLANTDGTPVWCDEPWWFNISGRRFPERFLHIEDDVKERLMVPLDPLLFFFFADALFDREEVFAVGVKPPDVIIVAGKDGAPARTVATFTTSQHSLWFHLAVDAHRVWYTNDGALWRVPRAGGTATRVLEAKPGRPTTGLLVDGDDVIVTRQSEIARLDDLSHPLVSADADIAAFARLDSGKWAWCTATELVAQR